MEDKFLQQLLKEEKSNTYTLKTSDGLEGVGYYLTRGNIIHVDGYIKVPLSVKLGGMEDTISLPIQRETVFTHGLEVFGYGESGIYVRAKVGTKMATIGTDRLVSGGALAFSFSYTV